MNFEVFSKAVHANFVEMSKGELYVVEMENDMGDMFLAAFPEGTNPIFRVRREYDCVCCKHFVRRLGVVVAIKDGKLQTIWDDLDLPSPFREVAAKLGYIIRNQPIESVFRTKERQYGLDHNYDKKTNQRYEHFHGEIGVKHRFDDAYAKIGDLNTTFGVFERGLMGLRDIDFVEVLELIDANGLYKGEEFRAAILAFQQLRLKFKETRRDTFIWENIHNKHARFRNTAIGNLFIELADGKEFDEAVKSYEKTVAPMNYKRPTTIITQGMVEKAVQALTNLGLHGAIARRYARLSDVSVNDVLFVDNESKSKMKDGISALLESSVKKPVFDPKKAEPIQAESFVKDILPTAKTIEVLVQNRHAGNFVSLTGADGPERLFKWSNNFAWSYHGDVADSVKERVKAAGGNIHAKLRVSLSWFNTDDLDLHAQTPTGSHIYFNNKKGILDVDMNAGITVRNPVENLAFNDLGDGVYDIGVHQFRQRETIDVGFSIEVEFDGVISQYSYSKAVKDMIPVFKLHVKDGKLVRIETDLVGGNTSKEKWGVFTEVLTPVTAVMYSPNHWGDNRIGAKHLIFALKGCMNSGTTRGIYNEFLRSDLEQHRKVFEVLGSKTKCPHSVEQISGVGFTAARGDTVTVVVDGRRAYVVSF